jgi:hypothetical protein
MTIHAVMLALLLFVPLTLPERSIMLPPPDAGCLRQCTTANCRSMCVAASQLDTLRAIASLDEGRHQDGKPHRCGQGFVTPIIEDTICPLPESYPWVWQRGHHARTYVRGPAGPVCRRRVELWNDWPECGGTPSGPALNVTVSQ